MTQNHLGNASIDLNDLHFVRVLEDAGSFTVASQRLHVTQSALTRRIQTIEARLGTKLFERTTRAVRPTEAGIFLLGQSAQLMNDVSRLLEQFQQAHGTGPTRIRVGVSTTITLAHLPGLFTRTMRMVSEIQPVVSHHPSQTLLEQLSEGALDVAVLCPPKRLPSNVRVCHRFDDTFTLIAPHDHKLPEGDRCGTAYKRWLEEQPWMALGGESETARQLNQWAEQADFKAHARMELDSFDLMIHLVAVGIGLAHVPIRAIAAFPRRHTLTRLDWPQRFTRELVVLTRKDRNPPPPISRFIEGILF